MGIKELDIVRVKSDILDLGIKKGMIGCVVLKYEKPELAYEVEFLDENGKNTITSEPTIILAPQYVEKIKGEKK